MARRTFENLRDELLRRVGRSGDTAFQGRAEELIKAAYFEVATALHHPELEANATETLAETLSVASLTLAETNVISAVVLRSQAQVPIKALQLVDFRTLQAALAVHGDNLGQPTMYSRFGPLVWVDRAADAEYELHIFYQLPSIEPVFTGGATSELAVQWDEVILNQALAFAWSALWRADLAATYERFVETAIGRSPQLFLRDDPKHGIPEKPGSGSPLGGPKG